MGLVDYSDSDSEGEPTVQAPPPTKKPANGVKPAFQKVVDRSNPGKIRVNLPTIGDDKADSSLQESEPAPKRLKTGGAFSGFNSFLPAPKKTGLTASSGDKKTTPQRKGLGPGFSLKTGAEPGFSREPAVSDDPPTEETSFHQERSESAAGESLSKESIPPTSTPSPNPTSGKPMMFKPLSVARKPQKKKSPLSASPGKEPSSTKEDSPVEQKKEKPQVSLFSMNSEPSSAIIQSNPLSEYHPLLYQAESKEEQGSYTDAGSEVQNNNLSREATSSAQGAQSLNAIAADLNLSESARRQLFGRQRGKGVPEAVTVVNFNTDEEYAANEQLRQSGETIKHNPVRAIASGKHSLKQLVNAARDQKDALEEHFAAGKRNKAEAGSKYGW